MRIALCTDSFLPIVDGVGRVCYEYACHLSGRGHECYVITPKQEMAEEKALSFELIPFMSAKVSKAPEYRAGIASLDRKYTQQINKLSPQLIHVHDPATSGLEGVRLARKLSVPLIGTFHSKYYDDIMRITHSDVISTIGAKAVALFYEKCDEVWTVSHNAAAELRSYGYGGGIRIVRNGCAIRTPRPEWEAAARERFSLSKDKPVLLYAGQIDVKKNLELIIRAAALLKRRGDFTLVLAGQGRDEEYIASMAERVGVEAVLTGHISDIRLLDGLYMAAQLFVFPSLYDTAGLVVYEAAAMGTPSVVIAGSAPAECIEDGESGLTCANTPESLCRAIGGYIYDMGDTERRRMAKKAQETIPRSWETVINEVEERYGELVR